MTRDETTGMVNVYRDTFTQAVYRHANMWKAIREGLDTIDGLTRHYHKTMEGLHRLGVMIEAMGYEPWWDFVTREWEITKGKTVVAKGTVAL